MPNQEDTLILKTSLVMNSITFEVSKFDLSLFPQEVIDLVNSVSVHNPQENNQTLFLLDHTYIDNIQEALVYQYNNIYKPNSYRLIRNKADLLHIIQSYTFGSTHPYLSLKYLKELKNLISAIIKFLKQQENESKQSFNYLKNKTQDKL